MPLIKVYSSAAAADTDTAALLRKLSADLAALLGKPEGYVMTCMMPRVPMTFGGDDAPSAYAEIKSIGRMSADTTATISASICATLSQALDVPEDRIYIEFQDAERHLWGFDGRTFA